MIRTPHISELESMQAAQQLRQLTETAAVAAARTKSDQNPGEAAASAMHQRLGIGELSCRVIYGEGSDNNDLQDGTSYGDMWPPRYDLAVDPAKGKTFVSRGQDEGMSIAALGQRGSLMAPTGIDHMNKLVVGPGTAARLMSEGKISIHTDPLANMLSLAEALGKDPSELTVAVLKDKRNERIRFAAHQIGAKILEVESGDVTPALQTCLTRDVDMLYGSGRTPAGIVTAAAVAVLGGNMQAMMDPRTPEEERQAFEQGLLGQPLDLRALVGDGELHFAATGIAPNPILTGANEVKGVWYPGTSIMASRLAKSNGHH